MEQQIARIALSGVPYSADKLYSYLVPPELADACRAGVRVSVPFGRGNRRTEGFVLETLCEAAQDHSARGHLVPLPRDLPLSRRCTGERLVSTCRGEPHG